jgi:hypothetical protein
VILVWRRWLTKAMINKLGYAGFIHLSPRDPLQLLITVLFSLLDNVSKCQKVSFQLLISSCLLKFQTLNDTDISLILICFVVYL